MTYGQTHRLKQNISQLWAVSDNLEALHIEGVDTSEARRFIEIAVGRIEADHVVCQEKALPAHRSGTRAQTHTDRTATLC